MIKILIADNSIIVREGLKSLLSDQAHIELVAEASDIQQLTKMLRSFQVDVVILDVQALLLSATEIKTLCKQFKHTSLLCITNPLPKQEIRSILDAGITSYLLKECDKQEITEAIQQTHNKTQFLCSKIIQMLTGEPEIQLHPSYLKNLSCQGIGVTDREADIIKLIAEGLSNKQIADKLCLSTHTVNTHRKNIMSKLGVNNTAGVVLFAVKNNFLEPNTYLFSST